MKLKASLAIIDWSPFGHHRLDVHLFILDKFFFCHHFLLFLALSISPLTNSSPFALTWVAHHFYTRPISSSYRFRAAFQPNQPCIRLDAANKFFSSNRPNTKFFSCVFVFRRVWFFPDTSTGHILFNPQSSSLTSDCLNDAFDQNRNLSETMKFIDNKWKSAKKKENKIHGRFNFHCLQSLTGVQFSVDSVDWWIECTSIGASRSE